MELERVFGSPVVEAYGMTEASHQMTSNPLPPLSRKPGSVGLASGPDVAIMDEAGTLLPTGQAGEVVIRGRNVTGGYENNPTANESSFTNGWFRTGDQGRFDDEGYLYLTGRLKEMINRGGEKIAPREIDEVLGDHPAVAQAVAFAVPHPTLGEDVAAAVVLKPGATALESDLVEFASARLADFKVPRRLLIVKEIPKGPTGKLQRIGLADKLADQLAAKQDAEFVAPESSIEQQISEIWREVLKVDRVGVRDNFYALGGDSLAMAVMVSVVEDRFGASIPIDGLLTAPTIDTIVALVGDKKTTDASAAAEPSRTSGPIRDTFLGGLKNRLFQYLALYAPGYKSTRVWLHRMRGVSIGHNVSIGLVRVDRNGVPESRAHRQRRVDRHARDHHRAPARLDVPGENERPPYGSDRGRRLHRPRRHRPAERHDWRRRGRQRRQRGVQVDPAANARARQPGRARRTLRRVARRGSLV